MRTDLFATLSASAVCEGMSRDEFLDDEEDLEELSECTIIDGGLNFGPLSFSDSNFKYVGPCDHISSIQITVVHYYLIVTFHSSLPALEVLSTIQEIRGALQIIGYPGTTFPYLRNLRRVGSQNQDDLVDELCEGKSY